MMCLEARRNLKRTITVSLLFGPEGYHFVCLFLLFSFHSIRYHGVHIFYRFTIALCLCVVLVYAFGRRYSDDSKSDSYLHIPFQRVDEMQT